MRSQFPQIGEKIRTEKDLSDETTATLHEALRQHKADFVGRDRGPADGRRRRLGAGRPLMANTKELRRRIASFQNTRKITKAMEMVSAARLRRAQQRIESTRPYVIRMSEFIAGLANNLTVDPNRFPLLKVHEEVKRVAVVALTADRGLAGAFNANIVRLANERLQDRTRPKGSTST